MILFLLACAAQADELDLEDHQQKLLKLITQTSRNIQKIVPKNKS